MSGVDPFAVRDLLGPDAAVCRRAVSGEHGIALPPLHNHHVHTHLVDVADMPAGGIAAVVDLGGDPVVLARQSARALPRLAYAGAFLTAPGGYPSGRVWAPDTILREVVGGGAVGTAGGVATAVDEQISFGASLIKVALNAATGPVPNPETIAEIVAVAHDRGLPVVAHVEGDDMTAVAVRAGADALAHVPFTEMPAELIPDAAQHQVWISTLRIHEGVDRERAIANAAAFVAAGGRLVYGTDLGNGDQPLGVDLAELRALEEAGLRGAALVAALTDPWPLGAAPGGVSTFIAGPPPTAPDQVAEWLTGAVVVPTEELVHDE